jgi:hypothetical protein
MTVPARAFPRTSLVPSQHRSRPETPGTPRCLACPRHGVCAAVRPVCPRCPAVLAPARAPLGSRAPSLVTPLKRTCRPTHARVHAGPGPNRASAMDGSRGELQGRPTGSPIKHLCHLPLHLHELAGTPSSSQLCPTARTAGRRRRPSPAISLPPLSPQIAPQGPLAPPHALPWPSPAAAHRNLARPPLPGRPGTTLQTARSFQGPQ